MIMKKIHKEIRIHTLIGYASRISGYGYRLWSKCGTVSSDRSEPTLSVQWRKVTCKNCLKRKPL